MKLAHPTQIRLTTATYPDSPADFDPTDDMDFAETSIDAGADLADAEPEVVQ